MNRMLFNVKPDEVRFAITSDTKLNDLNIEVPGCEQTKANIYKGVISSIEPSLGAVFVNYGAERHGFLPLKEISKEYFLTDDPIDPDNIRKLVKIGQPLVVQIEKEERGSKGAALSTFISLAGSYLVLMPNSTNSGGISRRIEGEEREQMRQALEGLSLPQDMGVIVRTAGLGKNQEELQWDLNILLRYWEAIKQAATAKSGNYLIHQEGDVLIRGIRDYLRQDIDEIIIDNKIAFERAHHYISTVRPDLVNRLKLYNDIMPLFSRFEIERQIETAYQRELRLPSGGSIVIDHTEALVAVDINSARATKGHNIEETALNTNREAAKEIARQLRIRDIGGLVVIDFIDMAQNRNQREVENVLRTALRPDRARIQLGRISRFGLMEMSRQRIRPSLSKANHSPCPRCDGKGSIRSIESQALSIIHVLQEKAIQSGMTHFQLQLPLELAAFICNEKKQDIVFIEQQCQVKISIIPNRFIEYPSYQLKQSPCPSNQLDHNSGPASYRYVKSFKLDISSSKHESAKPKDEPLINQFLSKAPVSRPTNQGGLIQKMWHKMFGKEHEGKLPPKTTKSTPSSRTKTKKTPAQKTQKNKASASTSQTGGKTNKTRRGSRGSGSTTNRNTRTKAKPSMTGPEKDKRPAPASKKSSTKQHAYSEEMNQYLPNEEHPAAAMLTKNSKETPLKKASDDAEQTK